MQYERHPTHARLACVASVLLAISTAGPASAEVYNLGASMTVNGTGVNGTSPVNFTSTIPLAIGSSSVDNGAINLTVSTDLLGSGAEWLVVDYQTADGSPILSKPTAAWEIQSLIPFLGPANGLGFYVDWGDNGTLINPTNALFSNTSLGTNPVTGTGTVMLNTASCPYASCGYLNTVTNTVNLYASLGTFGEINADGIPDTVDEFQMGIELQPASVPSTPLPATLPLFATGLGALGLLGWRSKRKARTRLLGAA